MVSLLLGVWLGVALGAPPPPPVVQTPRWEPLPATPDDRTTTSRLVQLWGDELLRAQCGARDVPRRRAVLDGALVDGPFSVPVRDESGWVFPPAPRGMDTWLVSPPGCALYRLSETITAEGAARLELGRSLDEVVTDVIASGALTETERAWLLDGDDRAARWATLRPPGPHPPGWTSWRADTTDATFTIRGPRRLVVSARWQDTPQALCLVVGEARACQTRATDERVALRDGSLTREPTREPPEGETALWRVLLPEGTHEVRVEGRANVELTGTWPLLYAVDTGEIASERVLIAPSGEDVERAVRAPDGAPQDLLLFGPTNLPTRVEDVRWIPLTSPDLQRAIRVDAPGVMTLHLTAEENARCTVRFGDDAPWRATPEDAVQRFLWTGDGAPDDWPEVEGCAARARVTGLDGALDAWSASRWWWVEPGGALTWETPGSEARIWVRHPESRQAPYRLRVRHPSGRVDHWTLSPRDAPADRWTARGGPWLPGVSIPLEPGDEQVEVWAEAPVVARLTALAPPASDPSDPSDPSDTPRDAAPELTPTPPPADLRALSRAIATATSDATRASALLARAAALEALGDDRLAWIDWERAVLLRPGEAEDNPITDRLQQRTATLLFGEKRWVPADPVWVPIGASEGAEAAAARGDWIGVAVRLRRDGLDPRPWWRQAPIAGQILTAEQRIAAFSDLVSHTPPANVEHPWLWPLRYASGWERVHQVRGGVSRAVRWPDAPPDGPDLFPEAWAREEIERLFAGYEVQIPSAGGRTLQVRCLATRVEAPPDGCLFKARDPSGRVLAETRADPWGAAATLRVPEDARTVYVGVSPSGGVDAQVKRPEGLARERLRDAWSVAPGGSVRFDVLGPTVIRLETWRTQGADAEVEVIARGGGGVAATTRRVAGAADVLLPIPLEGPVSVQVRTSHQVWVVPSLRVPRAGSRQPLADHRWIAAGLATVPPSRRAPPAEAPTPWVPPTGRPVRRPPMTVYLRTSVGTADADDAQPEPSLFPSLRGGQILGLASRPTRLPLWVDARLRGDLSRSGSLFSAGAQVEWLAHRGTFNLWLLGAGEWIRGDTTEAQMASARGRLRVQLDTWPWRRWQLITRLQADLYGVVDGAWDRYTYGTDMVRLWSQHKDQHPFGATWSGRARHRMLPWLDATMGTWLGSNAHARPLLEVWGTEVFLEGGRPGVWLRGGAELEHRFSDDDRRFGFWSPSAFARAAITAWPDRDLALQIGASGRYRFHFQDFEAMIEVRLYASRDRGLMDVAPSQLAESHLPEWFHEAAAERRRAVIEEETP